MLPPPLKKVNPINRSVLADENDDECSSGAKFCSCHSCWGCVEGQNGEIGWQNAVGHGKRKLWEIPGGCSALLVAIWRNIYQLFISIISLLTSHVWAEQGLKTFCCKSQCGVLVIILKASWPLMRGFQRDTKWFSDFSNFYLRAADIFRRMAYHINWPMNVRCIIASVHVSAS